MTRETILREIFNVGLSTGSNSNLTSSILSAGSSGNALGDLALIRSGAYKKLLSAYYKKDASAPKETESVDVDEKKKLVLAKESAANLKKSASELMDIGLSEENRGEIREKLQNFIRDYNTMLDSGSNVDTQSVLRNTLWMTQSTGKNSGLLSEIGITVGTDNKLSLDEEKFDKARLTSMNTLFMGNDSLLGRISAKADALEKLSAKSAADGTHAALYTNKGNFDMLNTNAFIDKLG